MVEGADQVVAAFTQQRLIGDGPRGDNPHHLPLDRPLAQGRIADLLADRHRFPQLYQLGQIAFDGVIGDPRHRDRRACRLTTLGQRDIQQLRGLARILVEQLVEVAHAIKQQDIRVLRLQSQILLHHGGVLFQITFFHQQVTG